MKTKFKVNDTIKVNNGVHTDEFDFDISGYVGIIKNISGDNNEFYKIEWDAITLNEMDLSSIQPEALQQYVWCFQLLYENEMELTAERCTAEESKEALNKLYEKIKKKDS